MGGGVPLLAHRCRREVASAPRSPVRSPASRRAPVPTSRQSPRFSRRDPVRPGVCREASKEGDTPDTPTSPLGLMQEARNRGVGTRRPWNSAPRPSPTPVELRASLC
ncbi:hypothetical protein NN561_008322 [Cricetulus griseus]